MTAIDPKRTLDTGMRNKRFKILVALMAAPLGSTAWAQKYFRNPRLVGRWSFKDARGASVLDISADGTWSAVVSYANGKPDDNFAGRWMCDDRNIYWEYTKSSASHVKVGARDKDELMSIGSDYFEVKTRTNETHLYLRSK